jgi:hypothetical protein
LLTVTVPEVVSVPNWFATVNNTLTTSGELPTFGEDTKLATSKLVFSV